ncbi:uncharacterized protein M421DRAFT_360470 [Didymella exigua CBS 183.55]|uniref:Uncharacterized protein n=1 Tax=Didymella exigua CBS 183.55 TaxID=1150837 RepID=A0A6A5RX15_9PLEO|nr:uncharacterized protein M421DRAFT_360470 [Didymella exigua CBS 183.55]KAF1930826.1 hypothetical protein M421DRAFT_360470 [Didymella exigua CBS 183.55]
MSKSAVSLIGIAAHTEQQHLSLLHKRQDRSARIFDSAVPRVERLLHVHIRGRWCDGLQDGAVGKVDAGARFLFRAHVTSRRSSDEGRQREGGLTCGAAGQGRASRPMQGSSGPCAVHGGRCQNLHVARLRWCIATRRPR